ncbi:MAG: hypothetical protein JO053_10615, partial [Acidobacteria bacterium]|nr:hypothetical protein [Acidobacteriota bacterium]
MKNTFRITIIASWVALFAAALNAQTVSGSIAGGKVARGKSAKATVTLSIPGGLHVNSNHPNSEYAIA